MARHGEILETFKQKVDVFDYSDEEHVTCVSTVRPSPLVSAASIKNVCFFTT